MKLRDSLVNMLGEFVGLNKTPDFKLNKRSAQYIAEAVAAESQRSLELRLAHVSAFVHFNNRMKLFTLTFKCQYKVYSNNYRHPYTKKNVVVLGIAHI